MRKNLNIFFIALISSVFLFGFVINSSARERQAYDRSIVLLASPSMTSVMHKFVKEFSQEKNISFSASFDSTKNHVFEIENGEPANLIITEDLDAMKDLQRKGLLNVFSIQTLVFNKLVLTLPQKHYLMKKLSTSTGREKGFGEKLKMILKNSLLTITDKDSGASGEFTRQVLENLGLWNFAKDKTIKVENSKKASYLSSNGMNPAIIYNSDAIAEDNLNIIDVIPENLYDKIIYQVAIIADPSSEENNNDAASFIDFLKSEAAKKTFQQHGFYLE